MPNTAKQEAMRKAYGDRYEDLKHSINNDGVYIGDTNEISDSEFKEWDFIASAKPMKEGKLISGSRPKSLQGIENNRGWIRIDSEEDLPSEQGVYWVYTVDDNKQLRDSADFLRNGKLNKYFTHYQPIVKPEKPIY